MTDNTTTLEADLEYAERMVTKGFSTPEQAAKICGVKLSDLMSRLGRMEDRLRAQRLSVQ